MTETCETWSIALEKERHGELSPEERAALERHLAGCPRCRAERASIAALSDELSAPGAAPPGAGWDDLRRRLERAHRARQREVAIGIVVSLLAGTALVVARGQVAGVLFDAFGSGIAAGMGFAICLAGFSAWLASRRAAKALPGDDLIGELRRYYLRRLRTLRFFAVFGPVYVLSLVFTNAKVWGQGPGQLVVKIAFLAGITVLALNGWFRTRPRLERELRALEGR